MKKACLQAVILSAAKDLPGIMGWYEKGLQEDLLLPHLLNV